jgi:RNA polymerase sigma-70 factor, ECF subfamily
MDDELDLLKRARSHDPAALGEIYDRYAGRLYSYIYAQIGHRETAQDMAAEVFLSMLQALDKGSFARTSLSAWLYQIAHNQVVDYYRRHRPILIPVDSEMGVDDSPVEVVERRWDQRRVRQGLACLSLDQRRVLVLRFGQKMKAKEVAEVLGKTEDAVRKLQCRALSSLRRILEGKR